MREQLQQLLALANISEVYIVDDALTNGSAIHFEHFIGQIKALVNDKGVEALADFDEALDFEGNERILEEYSRAQWVAAQPDRRLHFMRRLCELTPGHTLTTNLSIADVLQQLAAEEHLPPVALKLLSPVEWDEQLETILAAIPEGKKAIVLFDQVLTEAGGRFAVTAGIDLVAEVVADIRCHQLLPGILTYTVEDEGHELTERADLMRKKTLQAGDLFVLTKKRLENLPHFVDGIKKMLLNGPCEDLKKYAVEVVEHSFKTTLAKLLTLDTYDFDYTILRSSTEEGVWAPETLFRIIDIIYKDENKQYLLDHGLTSVLNKLLAQAGLLSKVQIPVADIVPYTEKFTLRHQEMYAAAEHINGLYKPIENGDIFRVVEGTGTGLYILVGQACDLMIRANGKRGSSVGHLLKIKPMSQAELDAQIKADLDTTHKPQGFNFWKTREVIEYIERGTQQLGLVTLTRANVVNLDVLDLAMFNSGGLTEINLATLSPAEVLHEGLAKRYGELHAQFSKVAQRITEGKQALRQVTGPWQKDLLQGLVPKVSHNSKLGKSDAYTATGFTFGLKRVQSLRDPYAKSLLDKYTRFLSRTADLHDFAEYE